MATTTKKTTKKKPVNKEIEPMRKPNGKIKNTSNPNYDENWNRVTKNTGKGKGIAAKMYYDGDIVASRNIAAPSPEQLYDYIIGKKPYNNINQMPLKYVQDRVSAYLGSIIKPEYLWVEKEFKNDDGTIYKKHIRTDTILGYKYNNIPSKHGIALALGVSFTSLINYVNGMSDGKIYASLKKIKNKALVEEFLSDGTRYDNSDASIYDDEEDQYYNDIYNNNRGNVNQDGSIHNPLDEDSEDFDPLNYNNNTNSSNNSNYNDVYSYKKSNRDFDDEFYNSDEFFGVDKEEKDALVFLEKLKILKRAYEFVNQFHEQRLGVNENVSGSIFALLNSRRGWTNNQNITVEHKATPLGSEKSPEQIEQELQAEIEMEKKMLEKDSNGGSSNIEKDVFDISTFDIFGEEEKD